MVKKKTGEMQRSSDSFCRQPDFDQLHREVRGVQSATEETRAKLQEEETNVRAVQGAMEETWAEFWGLRVQMLRTRHVCLLTRLTTVTA